jgi:hypothetical protein
MYTHRSSSLQAVNLRAQVRALALQLLSTQHGRVAFAAQFLLILCGGGERRARARELRSERKKQARTATDSEMMNTHTHTHTH